MNMNKLFKAHIITERSPFTTSAPVDGWGSQAVETTIEDNRIMQLAVSRDGRLQFEIHVAENGTLTLTDHAGMNFQIAAQQIRLVPGRKWKIE